MQATSSSSSHHECEINFGHIQVPQEVDSIQVCNKSPSSANGKGLMENLDIYGGSMIGNCAQEIKSTRDSELNSSANCQTSLIQTSQNQCYIVVQLNLPTSPEIVQDGSNLRYTLLIRQVVKYYIILKY